MVPIAFKPRKGRQPGTEFLRNFLETICLPAGLLNRDQIMNRFDRKARLNPAFKVVQALPMVVTPLEPGPETTTERWQAALHCRPVDQSNQARTGIQMAGEGLLNRQGTSPQL